MTYQWQHAGTNLPATDTNLLVITNVTLAHAGGYMAWVTNAIGGFTNTRTATLTLNPFIKITQGPVVTDRANFMFGTWADYDDDGFSDLFVPAGADVGGQAPAFYHNLGGTNFAKLTTNDVGAVVGRRLYCFQGLWADFNNDGRLDLLEIGSPSSGLVASNRFFLGRAAHTFDWVTANIGVNPPAGSWMCSLVDYDNDGAVDVYHTSGMNGQSRDRLYRNRGDGTFVHAWSPSGPIIFTQYGCWSDYDNDGDMDLWLRAQFYRNNGNGTFSGNLAGTEIPQISTWYGTWGDHDNDRYQDFLALTRLHHNNGNGSFSNVVTFPEGLCQWGDYDNDGDLDFVKGRWSQQPCSFYRNDGAGVFTQVDLGSPSRDIPAGESIPTWGDYNNDGFLDLFVGTRGNPVGVNFLYQNAGLAGGNTNHWLIVKPKGTASNRSAIGAKVRVQAMIRGTVTWQLREIQGAFYDDLRAHFGLGDATNVTALRIEWPSGIVQELQNVPANQFLTVVESQGYTNAAPQFTAVTNAAGGLQLSFTEPVATNRYILEASTDLVNWTKLMARTSAGSTTNYTDTGRTNYTRRFYRLQVP